MRSWNILLLCLIVTVTDGFNFNVFRYLVKEISSIPLESPPKYKTRWLEQKLDHYNKENLRTWYMRYFERLDFWKHGGPIYLFLGGEAEASPRFLYTGVMYELAKETNGALYASEHRYYGKSMPVNSTDVKSLKFLSAKQALADNANLINKIKSLPCFSQSKVVVFGGSYAGNLATWIRLLYPNIVDATVASSPPVLAKKDFNEYLVKVNNDYEQYGTESCLCDIKNMFQKYEKMFETTEGTQMLKKEENICADNDMTVIENKQLFFMEKASMFMTNAQYGDTKQIKNHCDNIQEKFNFSLFNELNMWVDLKQCYDYDFNNMINTYYKNQTTWAACWTYQTCTEFGYFQTTSSDEQPFTKNIPVEFYIKICKGAFGSEFNETRIDKGIIDINRMYGGLKPNITNVVFVNGDLDPWSRLSILEDISNKAPAIVIPRASHCRDLFSNRIDDPEELKEARKNIKNLIKKWIGAEKFIST